MIDKLQQTIKMYPQFSAKSQLYDDIVRVLSCSLTDAKDTAKTMCNLVSFWAILKAYDWYKFDFANFYRWMLVKNFCNIDGYINVTKDKIIRELGFESDLIKRKDWEDILDPQFLDEDRLYQIKIYADTKGDHFFSAYIENGIVYGCDTSYRGVPFVVKDKIKPDKFQWIMEI